MAENDGSKRHPKALGCRGREFSHLVVLNRGTNRAIGDAEKTLLRYALRERSEVGILLHSDGEYSPEKIPELPGAV
jgi:hypothetical protein